MFFIIRSLAAVVNLLDKLGYRKEHLCVYWGNVERLSWKVLLNVHAGEHIGMRIGGELDQRVLWLRDPARGGVLRYFGFSAKS